jgi:hypothetical protein
MVTSHEILLGDDECVWGKRAEPFMIMISRNEGHSLNQQTFRRSEEEAG